MGLTLGGFGVGCVWRWVWHQVGLALDGFGICLTLGGFGFRWVWHHVGLVLGGFGINVGRVVKVAKWPN